MVRPMDSRAFRDTVGRFATGVTVVTAAGADGPAGVTSNAFSSVSLDPPMVLVCFDRRSRTLPVVRDSGRFAVNVLHHGQHEVAKRFASKAPGPEKLAAVTHTVAHGVPVIDDVLAWFVCEVHALHSAGDHEIAIGRVTELGVGTGHRPPLLFYRGDYRTLAGA